MAEIQDRLFTISYTGNHQKKKEVKKTENFAKKTWDS
jgi:hypothetical protein